MEASTPEGKLNQEWAQKRNGVKFQLTGILTLLDKILSSRSEAIVEGEREQIVNVCNCLEITIIDFKLNNKKSKEQFLNVRG